MIIIRWKIFVLNLLHNLLLSDYNRYISGTRNMCHMSVTSASMLPIKNQTTRSTQTYTMMSGNIIVSCAKQLTKTKTVLELILRQNTPALLVGCGYSVAHRWIVRKFCSERKYSCIELSFNHHSYVYKNFSMEACYNHIRLHHKTFIQYRGECGCKLMVGWSGKNGAKKSDFIKKYF